MELDDSDGLDETAGTKLFRACQRTGMPLYCLYPDLFLGLSMHMKWNMEFSTTVVRAILENFTIRCTASTIIKLPGDHGLFFPGAGLACIAS